MSQGGDKKQRTGQTQESEDRGSFVVVETLSFDDDDWASTTTGEGMPALVACGLAARDLTKGPGQIHPPCAEILQGSLQRQRLPRYHPGLALLSRPHRTNRRRR